LGGRLLHGQTGGFAEPVRVETGRNREEDLRPTLQNSIDKYGAASKGGVLRREPCYLSIGGGERKIRGRKIVAIKRSKENSGI